MDHVAGFPIVIAAAGRSVRFGRPKLLETIPGTSLTLIGHVVRQCVAGGAGPVIVVLAPADEGDYGTIGVRAVEAGAAVHHISPAPREMRHSIEHGLRLLERRSLDATTGSPEFVGFMPADLPGVRASFVTKLIRRCHGRSESLVRGVTPKGRGLHPVALRWTDRHLLFDLPHDKGANALWENSALSRHDFVHDDETMRYDLDNPQDWEKFPFPRDRSGE